MAKKVTFTITGDANDAANKWAIIGSPNPLINTKLFRFVRPVGSVPGYDFSCEWQMGSTSPTPTSYEHPRPDRFTCTISGGSDGRLPNSMFFGCIRDGGEDVDKPATYYNPVVEFDGTECDTEVQHIPGQDGSFRLILKNLGTMVYPNTVRYSGRIVFTHPISGTKFYAYFDVTYTGYKLDYSSRKVRFETALTFASEWMDHVASLWLVGPGFNGTEVMADAIKSSMPSYDMGVDEDTINYVRELPQSTKLIQGQPGDFYIDNMELWESDFWMIICMPDGSWRMSYSPCGAAYDGQTFYI